jgi:hypothetical protein
MGYVDSILLNLTERFCRGFQRLTGHSNVWLAAQLTNLSIVVYFVWAGVYSFNSDIVLRLSVVLFCGGVLYTLCQTVFKEPIEAYENEAYRRVAQGLRNPRRVRDAVLRTSFLTLAIVLAYPSVLVYRMLHLSVAFLSYLLILLTTVVLYVLACDPQPPCAGKIAEWLRGGATLRAIPSEARGSDSRLRARRSA